MRKDEEKEIMEIQSNSTRRRRVTEIRSGDTDDENDNDSGGGKEQERRQGQRNKRGYRRRRRHDDDEQPFIILFLQVGTVLLLMCLATFHVYQYTTSNSNRVVSTNDTYGDDDDYDYDAVNAMEQQGDKKELKLNQLLHPIKQEQSQSQNNDDIDEENIITKAPLRKTAPPLPNFELSKSAEWDVFSTYDRFSPLLATENNNNNNKHFWQAVRELQKDFTETYGGENAARMLLDRGMTTFRNGSGNSNSSTNTGTSTPPTDVVATACRLRQAKLEKRPFRLAFGGYSVTTGHGNRHIDSYPFQLKEFLEPIIKLAGIVSLKLNNAAIGGVPSFPYGWCMKEFWGGETKTTTNGAQSIPDVVSWDFGMNEPGGPEGLEAYVRHLLSTYNSNIGPPPKLIVKDYFAADHRKEVLAEYSSLLRDPIILHTDVAAKPFLARDEEFRPLGFQKWREWGAPKGSPGQAPHHPAVQEHKLNGYILAMHFVTALEYMISMEERENEKRKNEDSNLVDAHNWCQQQTSTTTLESLPSSDASSLTPVFSLPPPVSRRIANDTKLHYDGILFGNPIMDQSISNNINNVTSTQNGTFVSWIMNPVRCRTTFEPKVSGDLSEIIVSGSIGEDLDVLLPKSQYYYNKGWTFDLSEVEKTAKKKLNAYPNGLGFRDSKEAYYGIYESSTMTLLLPYEMTEIVAEVEQDSSLLPKAGDSASEFYDSVVICQVNEKFLNSFDPDGCNFDTDVGVRIGGINVTQNNTKMFNTIGSVYLGKPICKHITIPSEALLTSHNTLLNEGENPSPGVVGQSDHTKLLDKDQTGLLVEVFVSNPHIVHINQACSISHVVWEEKATKLIEYQKIQSTTKK
jgi:hypothetical protein